MFEPVVDGLQVSHGVVVEVALQDSNDKTCKKRASSKQGLMESATDLTQQEGVHAASVCPAKATARTIRGVHAHVPLPKLLGRLRAVRARECNMGTRSVSAALEERCKSRHAVPGSHAEGRPARAGTRTRGVSGSGSRDLCKKCTRVAGHACQRRNFRVISAGCAKDVTATPMPIL